MKAAIFYGGKDIRVAEVPNPAPGPGEVVIRVRAAGICGSDLHGYREAGRKGAGGGGPHTSGHELAGEVAALGPGVAGLVVGQRVAVEPRHLVGCGRCRWCRRGDYHLCPQRGVIAGQRAHSTGFAEYSLESLDSVFPLPDIVPLEQAAILDVYACAVHALHLAPVHPGGTVVVQGAGAIGLTAAEVFRLGGAGQVIVCGTADHTLEAARKVGADVVINSARADPVAALMELTDGQGADVVVEAVGGAGQTFASSLAMAARGGAVVVVGMYSGPQTFDPWAMQSREIRLCFSNSYALWEGVPEFAIALGLLAAGKLRAGVYLTHSFPLERIAEGFAAAADKRTSGAIKVLVRP